MSEPVDDDAHWKCCKCSTILHPDNDVLWLEWDAVLVYACPACGHQLSAQCCRSVGRPE